MAIHGRRDEDVVYVFNAGLPGPEREGNAASNDPIHGPSGRYVREVSLRGRPMLRGSTSVRNGGVKLIKTEQKAGKWGKQRG